MVFFIWFLPVCSRLSGRVIAWMLARLVHQAGAGRAPCPVTARLNIEDARNVVGGGQDLGRVEPRADAHLVEHCDEILGREIADRAGGGWHRDPAPDTADRALDEGSAGIERRKDVGGRGAGEIVDVVPEGAAREGVDELAENSVHLARVLEAGRARNVEPRDALVAQPPD